MMPGHKKTLIALSLACAATLALGACGDKEAESKQAGGSELLPRSVTDDMLPYDTVRSQATLVAPMSASTAGARAAAAPTSESTEATSESAEAAREITAEDAEPVTPAPEAE